MCVCVCIHIIYIYIYIIWTHTHTHIPQGHFPFIAGVYIPKHLAEREAANFDFFGVNPQMHPLVSHHLYIIILYIIYICMDNILYIYICVCVCVYIYRCTPWSLITSVGTNRRSSPLLNHQGCASPRSVTTVTNGIRRPFFKWLEVARGADWRIGCTDIIMSGRSCVCACVRGGGG